MLKFLLELVPLAAFFIGYKMGGIMEATLYVVVASVLTIAISYYKERTINIVNMISVGLLLLSSSMTLLSGNPIFIKMKPTILYIIFAMIFLATNFKWQPAVKFLLGKAIILQDESKWKELNIRFMKFFLMLAVANELVWRNYPEETWVSFKVFGFLPITILFTLLQVPFLIRNRVS